MGRWDKTGIGRAGYPAADDLVRLAGFEAWLRKWRHRGYHAEDLARVAQEVVRQVAEEQRLGEEDRLFREQDK